MMRRSNRPVPDRPAPGQESVWDYPRPPRLEPVEDLVEIDFGGTTIASTNAAFRVLETSHPPTYYLPSESFHPGSLRPATGSSFCEWKGAAQYLDVVAGDRVAERAGWTYPQPTPPFAAIKGYVAVYPALMDGCRVDGETVVAQPGGFYGGWVTSRVVGPFKGEPGTWNW